MCLPTTARRLYRSGCLLALSFAAPLSAQSLHQRLQAIEQASGGKLDVACAMPPGAPPLPGCDLHADAHPPMQSVFKLPLAIAVLHQVEQGKLRLDQPIPFRKSDLFVPKAYSPLQDEFPQAGVDVPLDKLLHLSVSQSDNAAADVLLQLAGGPAVVRDYITSLGVHGFNLRHSEHELHRDETLQYEDWFAPTAAVELLRRLADRSPLNPEHTALVLGWMTNSARPGRLAGQLPPGVAIAHKTGTSDTVQGVSAATNDIGLVTLPNGGRLAVAVFLMDSTGSDQARDRTIAEAGQAIYQAAVAASGTASGAGPQR